MFVHKSLLSLSLSVTHKTFWPHLLRLKVGKLSHGAGWDLNMLESGDFTRVSSFLALKSYFIHKFRAQESSASTICQKIGFTRITSDLPIKNAEPSRCYLPSKTIKSKVSVIDQTLFDSTIMCPAYCKYANALHKIKNISILDKVLFTPFL